MNVLLINYPMGDNEDIEKTTELVVITRLATGSLYPKLIENTPFDIDSKDLKIKCRVTKLDNGNITIKFPEEK